MRFLTGLQPSGQLHIGNYFGAIEPAVRLQEKGGVQVVEIDADAYPAIANDYGLTKVPTTVFYTEGVKLRSIEGAYTAESLGRYLHALLTQEETAGEP